MLTEKKSCISDTNDLSFPTTNTRQNNRKLFKKAYGNGSTVSIIEGGKDLVLTIRNVYIIEHIKPEQAAVIMTLRCCRDKYTIIARKKKN